MSNDKIKFEISQVEVSAKEFDEGLSKETVDNIVRSALGEYYVRWLDMEIPMLNNITPRQASKTSEGKVLLEKLLAYMEKLPSPASVKPDISAIRKALGV